MKIKKIFSYVLPTLIGIYTPFTVITNACKASENVVSSTKDEVASQVADPNDIEFSTDYLDDFRKNVGSLNDEKINMSLGETRSAYRNRNDANLAKIYLNDTNVGYGGNEGEFYCPELKDNTIHFSTNEKSQNFRFITQKFSIDINVPANCYDCAYNVTLQNHFHSWYNVDFIYGTQMYVTTQLIDLDTAESQPSFYTNLYYGSEKDERCVADHYIKIEHEDCSSSNEYDENFEFSTQFKVSNDSPDPIKYTKHYALATMVDGESWKIGRTRYDLDSKVSVHLNSLAASEADIENNFMSRTIDAATKDLLSDKNMVQPRLAKIYDSQIEEIKKFKNENFSNVSDTETKNFLQQIQANCNIKFNTGNDFASYYIEHKDEYANLINNAATSQKQTNLEIRKHKAAGWQRFSYFINNQINLKGFSADEYNDEKIAFTSLKAPNEADDSAKGFNGTMSGKGQSFVLSADNTRGTKVIYLPIKLEITCPANINSLSNIVTGWTIDFKSSYDLDSYKESGLNKYGLQIFDFGDDEKAVPEFINVASSSNGLTGQVDKHCVYSNSTCSGESNFIFDPLKEDPENKSASLYSCLNENNEVEKKYYRYYGIAISSGWLPENYARINFEAEFTPAAIDTNISTSNIYHKGYSSSEKYTGETIPMSQLNGDLNDGGYTVSGGVEGNLYEGKNFETNLRAFYSRTRLTTILPPHTQACYNVNLSVKSDLQRNAGLTAWDIYSGNNISVFDLNSQQTPDPDFIPNYGYSADVKSNEQAIKNHLVFSKNKEIYGERDWSQILMISILILAIIIDTCFLRFDGAAWLEQLFNRMYYAIRGGRGLWGIATGVSTFQKIACWLSISIVACYGLFVLFLEGWVKKPWCKKFLYYQDISNIKDASAKYDNIFETQIQLTNETDEAKKFTYDFGISFVNNAQRSQEIGTKPFFLTKFDINLMYYESTSNTSDQKSSN